MSQLRSRQIECEALLHTLCETDENPWCFVPIDANSPLKQSHLFRRLWNPGYPRGPVPNTDEDATNLPPPVQELLATPHTHTSLRVDDHEWAVRMTVVMDNDGQPVGRLIRLSLTGEQSENGAMILASHDAQRRLTALSPRETEILKLVYEGLTNKAIAARTNISQKTVEKHRGRVSRKLHTSSLAELIRLVAVARYTDSTPTEPDSSDTVG